MILCIKTDQPDAYLAFHSGYELLVDDSWVAHRQLSVTIMNRIEDLLTKQDAASVGDISGVVVFRGPGSFTGLRIGVTVANTLAYSLKVPIVGTQGDQWLEAGVQQLARDQNDQVVLPEYGAEPNITKPRK